MHTSRRRRTTTRLNADNYDPKTKSNNNKQTMYIIIGVFIFVIGLLIIYKVFSVSNSVDNNNNINYNYYENEQQEIENMENIENNIPDMPGMNMPNIPNMNEINEKARKTMFGLGAKKNKLFKNPLNPLKGGMFDVDKKKQRMAGMGMPGLDDVLQRAKAKKNFGNMENYKKMMNDGPFSNLGEGPIFNSLNKNGAKTKLSPEQMHAAKEKLRNNMRGMPGKFGGLEGLHDQMRQHQKRREEM